MYNMVKMLILVFDLIENCLLLMNVQCIIYCLKFILKFMIFRIKGRYLDFQLKVQFDLYVNFGFFFSFRVICSCLIKYF